MGHTSKNTEVPYATIIITYICYGILFCLAYLREMVWKFGNSLLGKSDTFTTPKGYAPIMKDFDYFWSRRLYGQIRDCYDRPISSMPGPKIDVLDRVSYDNNATYHYSGKKIPCLNLGSYNYLGFSENSGPCTDHVIETIRKYGPSTTSSTNDYGTTKLHKLLEEKVAKFVGKEAAIVFGMGYQTNSTNLPQLIGKGGLIISDALNHASLVVGCRQSGAKITTFRHNDAKHLEKVLRRAIAEGQPHTHRPWTKILILVEGINSMEGSILPLKEIVEIKKKYKAYLYVDEAHSIGAIGKTGRGICDYCGVDPADVDILMGTFTKSFASVGGYVAGSAELINWLRVSSFASNYDTSMSSPCAQQILSALTIITGEDGTAEGLKRITQLHENSVYFRKRLQEMGFVIIGDHDSPVIPMLLVYPSKIPAFSRECLKRNIAVVVVGFPATPLILSRARFCMSASHSREDLDTALDDIEEIGERCLLKYYPATVVN